jgi:predicted ribonuclease YlaK
MESTMTIGAMQTLFISQDLWDVIEEGYEEPSQTSSLTLVQLLHKENFKNFCVGVSKSISPRIANAAWEILQKEFQGSEKVLSVKLQTLWRDFDNLAMKESERVRDFFSRVALIVNQIRSGGDTIEEKKIVEKILRS